MTTYAIYKPNGKVDTYRDGKKWKALTFNSYDDALEFLNSDIYDTTEGYSIGIYAGSSGRIYRRGEE